MFHDTRALRLGALSLTLGLATACAGDAVTSPRAARPSLSSTSYSTATVTFLPAVTSVAFNIGPHQVVIPAGAICDPLLSSYGPTEWNKSCLPATAPITLTARYWVDATGRPTVEFSPDVRFAPSKTVVLHMRDQAASAAASSAIVYCDATGKCVNESASDPDLAVRRDRGNGFVSRRIKHFSGYNVILGFESDSTSGSGDGFQSGTDPFGSGS